MKKKILWLVAAAMVFTLCACGNKEAGQNASDDGVIKISKSDEAQKYEEENTAKDLFGKAIQTEGLFEEMIAGYYDRTEQNFPDCSVQNKLDCEEFEGSKVYSLTKDDYECIVIYIHGGGWVFEIGDDHVGFCDELVTKLNAKVYMPLYPLAPQATSDETYAMIEDFYKEVLKEGKDVYIMGDSAGGNIALGLLYTIKAEGLEKPKKAVLLSPCADMTFSNEAIAELDETDPVLAAYGSRKCAELWAGEENLTNPKNSAIYADVTGYPDIMIVQGTNEIVYPDVMILYENLKKAGVNTRLVLGEGLWHVFPVDSIPEKDTVLELIGEFCKE